MKSTIIAFAIVLAGLAGVYWWFQSRTATVGTVPEWASFFTPRQYNAFLADVESYFTQQKRKVIINDGVARVENDATYRNQMGLQNLAQMCRLAKQSDWPNVIADHFGSLAATERSEAELKSNIGDFHAIRDQLAVRLWPEEYLKNLRDNETISRSDLKGTVSVLVWDLPTHQRNVLQSEAKAWGKSTVELFAIGLENLKADKQVEVVDQDLQGVKVKILLGESFLVASRVFQLEQLPGFTGKHGAVTAVPHRHMLISFPIEDASVIFAVNKLIPLVQMLEKQGPGSISPKIYWYHDHQFTDLPYAMKGQNVQFMPPDDFAELMNRLTPLPTTSH